MRAKRLRVLLTLERRSAVRFLRRGSAVQHSGRPLQPEASAIATRPSRTRGRRRLREQHETPRVLRKSYRLREGLRGFRRRACLRFPSAASRRLQLRAVWFVRRGIASTIRRSASPFSFSRLSLVHLRPNRRPCRPVHRPASNQNRSPRTCANFVHIGSRQSSRQRSGTRSSAAGRIVAESFHALRFKCCNAGFKGRDLVGGLFPQNVRPVLHDAQSPGGNCIAGQSDDGRQDQANLFSVEPGRCRNAGSVAGFTECSIAGGTGDSCERFSKARRLRQGDQLSEFRRPSTAPKKKTAAIGSFRLAAFGQLPCLPSV